MGLKGKVQGDHMPLNKYQLSIVGLPTIDFITVAGLESEVDTVDLPDRTKATGGQIGTSELTVAVPSHHEAQIFAMEIWLQEAQDPVTITYKKGGILTLKSNSGQAERVWVLAGVFCSKRSIADMGIENVGELATTEYTLMCDEISPSGLPL